MNKRSFVTKIRFLLIFTLIFSLVSLNVPAQAMTSQGNTIFGTASQEKISPQVQQVIQSSDDGEMYSVIVALHAQANLSNVLDRNRSARINQVVTMLQNIAEATQNRIRALLRSRLSEGKVTDVQYFWIFNGLAVTATAEVIQEIAALPEVSAITPNETIQAPALNESLATPETNLSVIKAPDLWQLGYQGQGIIVANMDTGVDFNNTDLNAKWRGGTNSWFDPNGEHLSVPTDYNGHGTWVMGVMVGGDMGGTTVGVAPAAQWIAVKIFNDRGSATVAGIHAGYQWLLDPDGNPATADAPHVVNNSWTYQSPGCNLEFDLDLQSLFAAGIVPVFAAGNYGPNPGTSVSPSNNPFGFAVGGTDNNDFIYTSSSRGPSNCNESQAIYPEIVAPGVNIHTTDLFNLYTDATGTSLAAPHVAGGLALLLNAFPNLLASEQESALLNSAEDLGIAGPDNEFGYGRLDLLSAYQWIENNASTPTPTPAPNNLALNQPVTVSSSQDNAHGGEQAVDGDTFTYWQSKQVKGKGGGPSSEWISVDLGGSTSITGVVLKWGSNYATSYAIQTSNDGNAWTTVFNTTSENGGDDVITLSVGSARYVRMESTAWSDSKLRNWLIEFEVYGGSVGPMPTETPTPSPSPTSTPPPGNLIVHVGDLDGSSIPNNGGRWDATVTITIHDGNESLIDGVTVTGSWSAGGSGSCVTDSLGQCNLNKNNLKGNQPSVEFTVESVSNSGYVYQSSANHDLESDSDGSVISVTQP